jgi:hypothetical protein
MTSGIWKRPFLLAVHSLPNPPVALFARFIRFLVAFCFLQGYVCVPTSSEKQQVDFTGPPNHLPKNQTYASHQNILLLFSGVYVFPCGLWQCLPFYTQRAVVSNPEAAVTHQRCFASGAAAASRSGMRQPIFGTLIFIPATVP